MYFMCLDYNFAAGAPARRADENFDFQDVVDVITNVKPCQRGQAVAGPCRCLPRTTPTPTPDSIPIAHTDADTNSRADTDTDTGPNTEHR